MQIAEQLQKSSKTVQGDSTRPKPKPTLKTNTTNHCQQWHLAATFIECNGSCCKSWSPLLAKTILTSWAFWVRGIFSRTAFFCIFTSIGNSLHNTEFAGLLCARKFFIHVGHSKTCLSLGNRQARLSLQSLKLTCRDLFVVGMLAKQNIWEIEYPTCDSASSLVLSLAALPSLMLDQLDMFSIALITCSKLFALHSVWL